MNLLIICAVAHVASPLSGLRVILDLGHGGSDPGMSWICNGHVITEAGCTYRMGYELERYLEKQGAVVVLTTQSQLAASEPATCLLRPTDACYTINGKPVHAGMHGCSIRMNGWEGHKHQVWIALHVDSSPLAGPKVYVSNMRHPPELARYLAAALQAGQDGPVRKRHRVPIWQEDLYIFNNPYARGVSQRLLLEMGSPKISASDCNRLVTPSGRLKIICAISQALRKLWHV